MKKLNFLLGAAMIAFAASFTSCDKLDNPAAGPSEGDGQYQTLFTYDFAAASAAEENPGNKNGSAANGQAFYGWEAAEKTDSKRQDYKGYEWAEGSVLPTECHVWRRSDRINGNVGEGGLKFPNNREVAIDGLEAGSVVEFVYDATGAADGAKEILWAAPIATDESGIQAPRVTATIAGKAAVSGETTIASGQKIEVNSVTPADNGTGYIVVRINKGTILQKVVISKKL